MLSTMSCKPGNCIMSAMNSSLNASAICWLSSISLNRKGNRCKRAIQTVWVSRFKVRTMSSRNFTKSIKLSQQICTEKITRLLKRWIGKQVSRKLTRFLTPTPKAGEQIWKVSCTTEICIRNFCTIRGQFKTRTRAICPKLTPTSYKIRSQKESKNFKLTLNGPILVKQRPKRESSLVK